MSLLARIVAILLLALLPALGIQVYNEIELRRAAEAQVRESALREARLMAAEIDRLLTGLRNALFALSDVPAIQLQQAEACTPILQGFMRRIGMQGSVALAGADGRELCSSIVPPPPPHDLSDRPHFRLPAQRRDFAVGGYTTGRITGAPLLGMGTPIFAPDGALRGVLMAVLDLAWLRKQLLARGLPPDAAFTLADREGRILLRLPDAELEGRMLPEGFRWMLQARAEGVVEGPGPDGVRRVVGYLPFTAPSDLFVSFGFSTETAYAAIRAAARRAYGLTGLGFALALLLAVAAARRGIAGPVRDMLAAVERWRGGARGEKVPVPEGGGEFARIAVALNELTATAERNEASLRHRLAEIEALFESAPVGLGLLDPQFRFVTLNRLLADLNGLPIQQHIGRKVPELLPELAPRLLPLLQDVLRSGQGRHGVEVFGPTHGTHRADRSWLVAWHPVRGAKGEVAGIAVAVQETTAQRDSEAALRETEHWLDLVQDAIGLGTFDLDMATGRMRWSPRQYELHFMRPVPGQPGPTRAEWLASLLPEDRPGAQLAHATVQAGRTRFEGEYRVRDPETGELRWLRTRARIFLDPQGRPLRVVGVNFDATERHATRQALAEAHAMLEGRAASP